MITKHDAVRLLAAVGKCQNCGGTGTFDHGTGEGRIGKCIPCDPKNHRYCRCEECHGAGIDPAWADIVRKLTAIAGR